MNAWRNFVAVVTVLCSSTAGLAGTPSGTPLATIDLLTREGAQSVKGEWRYSDTRIIGVEHRRPDRDGQPAGEVFKTYDYSPHAGGIDFDDAKWATLDPTTLSRR